MKTTEVNYDAGVLYRLPGSNTKHFLFGKADVNVPLNEVFDADGFYVHPFDIEANAAVFISTAEKGIFSNDLPNGKLNNFIRLFSGYRPEGGSSSLKEDYSQTFKGFKELLDNGILDKVILSRTIVREGLPAELIVPVFMHLCDLYPQAFVYAVHTHETGTWIGAGPELLLGFDGSNYNTVSLAGTMPFSDSIQWSAKEIEEQQMVTDYMVDVLNNCGVSSFKQSDTYTVKAGPMAHLRTDFSFDSNLSSEQVAQLINQLHPTPAVCGLPKHDANSAILKAEHHSRDYYSGFLGPVNKKEFGFYVNIRCLRLTSQNAVLYVGGGLTRDSDPEKEWQETELKAQTLLAVLKNISTLQGYE